MKNVVYNRYPLGNKRFKWRQKDYVLSNFAIIGRTVDGDPAEVLDKNAAYLKEAGVVIAPSKAVNAGGVAVSGLEMSQNSMRYSWTAEEVDAKLKQIMKNIFEASASAAKKYGMEGDLVAGANIAGFEKVAEAMLAQGVC